MNGLVNLLNKNNLYSKLFLKISWTIMLLKVQLSPTEGQALLYKIKTEWFNMAYF